MGAGTLRTWSEAMSRIGRRREARQRLQHLHPGPDPLLARAHGPAAPAADQALLDLLLVYDNAVCVIFLMDFAMNLVRAKPTRAYFIGQRGWLDLIGSIPAFGFFQASALFRLARISRLARITKLLRGQAGKDLVIDVLANRSQYATFITILLAGMVLSISSFVVLQVESGAADANITTGGDALWWGLVTITTVGYGDFFPVTTIGRLTGAFVMFAGVGSSARSQASSQACSSRRQPLQSRCQTPTRRRRWRQGRGKRLSRHRSSSRFVWRSRRCERCFAAKRIARSGLALRRIGRVATCRIVRPCRCSRRYEGHRSASARSGGTRTSGSRPPRPRRPRQAPVGLQRRLSSAGRSRHRR